MTLIQELATTKLPCGKCGQRFLASERGALVRMPTRRGQPIEAKCPACAARPTVTLATGIRGRG